MKRKSLYKMIRQTKGVYFPVKGKDGYAGEQDGTYPVLAMFTCSSREQVKGIQVADCFHFNWLRYEPKVGWIGAIGCWSNFSNEEVWKPLLPFINFV